MIDLHSHILPGIDDGAANLEQSLAMARLAVADGIHTIVATPHCDLRTFPRLLARRDAALVELRQALDEHGIPLRILPGAECCIHPDLVDVACDNPGLFLGENYRILLVELAPSQPLDVVGDLLFRASSADLTLVLAHTERYLEVSNDPARIVPLVEQGLQVQINATSLRLSAGWRLWRTARKLIGRRLASILASDAHDMIRRPPQLAAAVGRATRLLKQDARPLVLDNPARLLGIVGD
jgi:protein-tyrosine phosphatase